MRNVVVTSPARSRVLSALGALVLVCGFATSSRAVVTNSITEGILNTYINALDPIFDALDAPVTPTAVGRDGSNLLTALQFQANIFQTTGFLVPVTDPGAYPIAGIQATVANAAADFVRASGKIGGKMPLVGVNKVCLFAACSGAVANLTVPISVVGTGGTATASGAVNLTVIGAPWTQGTAAVGTITRMGNAGASTQMNISGGVSNVLQLVTPIFVSTNIAASSVVPVWGVLDLTLTSVPEPGTLAAFGAAIVALVGAGFARRR